MEVCRLLFDAFDPQQAQDQSSKKPQCQFQLFVWKCFEQLFSTDSFLSERILTKKLLVKLLGEQSLVKSSSLVTIPDKFLVASLVFGDQRLVFVAQLVNLTWKVAGKITFIFNSAYFFLFTFNAEATLLKLSTIVPFSPFLSDNTFVWELNLFQNYLLSASQR